MSWLVEDPTYIYLILAVVAIGLIVALWVKRDRPWLRLWLVCLAGVVVVTLLVFLLDQLIVSDGELIQESVEGMRAAVQRHDTAGVMEHIAKDFKFQSLDRAAFGKKVEAVLGPRIIDDVVIWEVDELKVDRPARKASVAFRAKPKSNSGTVTEIQNFLVRADFVLEDGQWKMHGFRVFNPFVETDKPLDVPLPP